MRISDWSSDVCSSDLLERYRYDLNFYAGIAKPALVVSNWDDPELKHQDNWRKELYDAGLFDPESAAKLLINPEQLLSLICKKHAGSLWLLGDKNTVQRYRSEEHASELQSLMRISYAVFCLKTKPIRINI